MNKQAALIKRELTLNEINKESKKNLDILISKNENYYHSQINEIVEDIVTPRSKIKVLLLSGPSSAGKTTSSNILCSSLEKKGINSIVISLDNF
ncbi:MAG: hypothetical protein PHS54_03545, partial [Clostridia bacterium]|nr:hypothetical protein [Clostridia bacterium]